MDGLSDIGKSVHRSGSELGQFPLHVRQAEAGQLGRDAEKRASIFPGRRFRLAGKGASASQKFMSGSLAYIAKRLGQLVLVVFIGINLAYVITHATPIDPVEQSISVVTSFGNTAPEAIEQMRTSLRELYGLEGSAIQQYVVFWNRILRADFGPSMAAFPTPVSTLIARALPWTTGLLVVSTIVTWVLGNLLGGLAGYYQRSRGLKLLGVIAMGLHPIPYYILALLLLIVFGFLWPVLPIAGGSAMNLPQAWSWAFVTSVLKHSILPALSLILIGVGSWFLGLLAIDLLYPLLDPRVKVS